MWMKWHPDIAIAQQASRQLYGSIRTHWVDTRQAGGKLSKIILSTTPTPVRLAVQFGYRISPTGGVNREEMH